MSGFNGSVSLIVGWIVGAITVLLGAYAKFWLDRKYDKERSARAARDQRRRDDVMGYEALVRDWYKLLDIQLAYPELGLESSEPDIVMRSDSIEARRRFAAYDLLMNILVRAFALREALQTPSRLGKIDTWRAWDAWATDYFGKASVRDHFAVWRGKFCPPEAEQWMLGKTQTIHPSPRES